MTITKEKVVALRNESNYAEHCAMQDYSKTGIKEVSVWNEVHHFHVTQNLFHELFQSVFHKSLSPKMHFMTHYPRIMNGIGPLCNVSSLRYESFHKIFKNMIKNNNCRKDIIASCVFKVKKRCAHIFINFKTLNEFSVVTGKKKEVSSLEVLSEFHCSVPLKESVSETKFAEIDSVVYKVGIVLQDKEDKGGIPCFLIVRKIFLLENQILLGCQRLINLGFDNHFCAYKVDLDFF